MLQGERINKTPVREKTVINRKLVWYLFFLLTRHSGNLRVWDSWTDGGEEKYLLALTLLTFNSNPVRYKKTVKREERICSLIFVSQLLLSYDLAPTPLSFSLCLVCLPVSWLVPVSSNEFTLPFSLWNLCSSTTFLSTKEKGRRKRERERVRVRRGKLLSLLVRWLRLFCGDSNPSIHACRVGHTTWPAAAAGKERVTNHVSQESWIRIFAKAKSVRQKEWSAITHHTVWKTHETSWCTILFHRCFWRLRNTCKGWTHKLLIFLSSCSQDSFFLTLFFQWQQSRQ